MSTRILHLIIATAITATVNTHQSTCFAEETVSQKAMKLAEFAQRQEDLIVKGARWTHTRWRGRTDSLESGLNGEFSEDHPVDEYKCRWLCNEGHFLYEIEAQQPQRKQEVDEKQRIVEITPGSETYLWSPDAHLMFWGLAKGKERSERNPGYASIHLRQHGLAGNDGFGSSPIHGLIFGHGHIVALKDYIRNKENKISLTEATSRTGDPCDCLTIRKPNEVELKYYFDRKTSKLIQSEQLDKNGMLQSLRLITDMESHRTGNGELFTPQRALAIVSLSFGKPYLIVMESEKFETKPVPLQEMSVDIENMKFAAGGAGRTYFVEGVKSVTADDLEDVAAKVFDNVEKN